MPEASATEKLFFEALAKGSETQRARFLDSACQGQQDMRRQVEKLLRAHSRIGFFLSRSAVEQFAVLPKEADAAPVGDSSTADLSSDEGVLDFLQPSSRSDSLGRIGHYEVLEVLGRGGFGIVLRAIDEALHRVVAVKVLAPQLAATAPARRRFVAEARSYAKIRHANVVQVFSVEEQQRPYLVMEFVPGETLHQRIFRTGSLEIMEVLQIGRQIAEGLAATHAMGLIHRDVKPENILLESSFEQHAGEAHVKISDFGLARAADDAGMTQNGNVAGTPMFMSPEQAMGEALDHRSDLFSLGSVLYTMCCGQPPFRGKNTFAVLRRVVENTPQPLQEIAPETPQWLGEIIARLHAKNPEERFASAREVAELLASRLALMQHLQHAPAFQAAVAPARRFSEAASTRWASVTAGRALGRSVVRRWAALAAAILMLLGGLGFTEASGVTDFQGTVIRMFSPEGTLVVEVDDPEVSVRIDGAELVITGAGAKEIRLRPGRYAVEALKDGKLLSRELVAVTKNGRQVVRISQEPVPDTEAGQLSAETIAWERSVATLPTSEQRTAVFARLAELNSGLRGSYETEDPYFDLMIRGLVLEDLSPIRALSGLKRLFINVESVYDLAPLQGMELSRLAIYGPGVSDLFPLQGMRLKELNLSGSVSIADLSPLKGMPLESLTLAGTQASDLEPLRGMRLKHLNCDSSNVSDLSPLQGMPLTALEILNTRVKDLSPLRDMPLINLNCTNAPVDDACLEQLKGCKNLQSLLLKGTNVTMAGIEELKNAVPNCRIEWSDGVIEPR